MTDDVSAVKDVLKQYAESCTNGDFEHWISLWADDGVQMPPASPAREGKAQITAAMKISFEMMDLELTIHEIEDAAIHGDLGLTRCSYSLRGKPKDGGDTVDIMPNGKALTTYSRQADGAWKIAYDCFNSST